METGQFKQHRAEKLSAAELAEIDRLGSPLLSQLAQWANKRLTCSHCGRCTLRCEVLKEPALDIGTVEAHYERVMAEPEETRRQFVIDLMNAHPELYHALRRCCFCGYCTADCQAHMLAPDRMRAWREIFAQVGYLQPDKMVAVDQEWHIFSAYRAIYGIGYPEVTALRDAAAAGSGSFDTAFFPGCSLVSYAPDLTRAMGQWLTGAGFKWVLSDDCCGSPLMSAGLFDRAQALRQRILDQVKAAGITRVVTVCPGCGEEFSEIMGGEVDIVPLPELMLQKARELEAAAGIAERSDGLPEDPAAAAAAVGLHPLAGFSSATIFDSCHDRHDGRHGRAIRKLFARYLPQMELREMDEHRKQTLCCGAGGAVGVYDADITQRRVWRVIDEGRDTGAEALVTMCPTCTYTIAQACLGADPTRGIEGHHYLELLLGQTIDWPQVFQQLNDMWTGEYGPWLNQTFFA